MKILSIDSATAVATCAILDKDTLVGETSLNYKKQHSVLLMTMIDELLINTENTIDDIDGFVVSKGPGSFTGLRIGMATIKGLCHGTKKPFVSISTLDALAYNLAYTDGLICPILDALRGNVYTALYKFEKENLIQLSDYDNLPMDDLISTLKERNEKVTFIGDGTYKFKEKIKESQDNFFISPIHLNIAKASSIGELGLKKLMNGEKEDLYSSIPIYLRKSQAEREYEERTGVSAT